MQKPTIEYSLILKIMSSMSIQVVLDLDYIHLLVSSSHQVRWDCGEDDEQLFFQ